MLSKNEYRRIITPYLNEREAKYILALDEGSTDLDIYVITTAGKSSFITFYYNNRWIEIFIDSVETLNRKIMNYDEIIINFVWQFNLIEGNAYEWNIIRQSVSLMRTKYLLPLERRKKVMYRVHVLATKFRKDDFTNLFIMNTLTYHIAYLLIVNNNEIPDSPRLWPSQIKNLVDENVWKLFDELVRNTISYDSLQVLIGIVLKDFDGLRIEYDDEVELTMIV